MLDALVGISQVVGSLALVFSVLSGVAGRTRENVGGGRFFLDRELNAGSLA
jgi:hypothetical protein